MWNLLYPNKTCNSKNRFRDHKEHIDRIYNAKHIIDTSEPSKPKFFVNGAKKKVMKYETERKVNYENRLLYSKMQELHNKPSPYSQSQNIPLRCPAFDRNIVQYSYKKKIKEIYEGNKKLRKRFLRIKPIYNTNEFIQDFQYSNTIKENICNKDNNSNLEYAKYPDFKKQLNIVIKREQKQINENDLYLNTNYYRINNVNRNNTINDFKKYYKKRCYHTGIKPAINTKDYSYPHFTQGETSSNTEINVIKSPLSSRPNSNVNMHYNENNDGNTKYNNNNYTEGTNDNYTTEYITGDNRNYK